MSSIFMDGESVRAILLGEKGQTRRLVKPQPPSETARVGIRPWGWAVAFDAQDRQTGWARGCPYSVGQVLYVRETWSIVARAGTMYTVVYRADSTGEGKDMRLGEPQEIDVGFEGPSPKLDAIIHELPGRWRPSIFMPLWAARLFLRVTRIRAERVQDISAEDTVDEGVAMDPREMFPLVNREDKLRVCWTRRWNGLYAKFKPAKRNPYTGEREDCRVAYPWESSDTPAGSERGPMPAYRVGNPWIFAYSFERAEKGEG